MIASLDFGQVSGVYVPLHVTCIIQQNSLKMIGSSFSFYFNFGVTTKFLVDYLYSISLHPFIAFFAENCNITDSKHCVSWVFHYLTQHNSIVGNEICPVNMYLRKFDFWVNLKKTLVLLGMLRLSQASCRTPVTSDKNKLIKALKMNLLSN